MLGTEAEWIRLLRQDGSVQGLDFELVVGAFLKPRNEQFPDARRSKCAHRMTLPVPEIEAPHDGYPPCIRGPNRKVHTFSFLVHNQMGTQGIPKPGMAAFIQEVLVKFAEHRSEPVGVVNLPAFPTSPETQTVIPRIDLGQAGKEPRHLGTQQFADQIAVRVNRISRVRARHECPDGPTAGNPVGSQHAERIPVVACGQRTRPVRFEEFLGLGHGVASTRQISLA